VAEGRLQEAAAVVAERAPLVEVLGQVCFHPCEDGSFAPEHDESETAELPMDAGILAVGRRPDLALVPESMDGIFLAGDQATGPGSVVEAIASAREAAFAADRFLDGPGVLTLKLGPTDAPVAPGRAGCFDELPRLEPVGPETAREEADRCLRCDLRPPFEEESHE